MQYKGRTDIIQAENRNGRFAAKINELTSMFGNIQFPIRSALELLDLSVDWDGDTRTILVKDKPPIPKPDLEILERITQAEAGGEDMKGRILVVNVIMNRMYSAHRSFQNVNTVTEVVFAERQFEPTRNGAFERAVVSEGTREAVLRALDGEDYSQGALWFRAIRGAEGGWHETALTPLFDHGCHRFYI